MRKLLLITIVLTQYFTYSQDHFTTTPKTLNTSVISVEPLIHNANINSKYNDFSGTFYKNKFIISSQRKIGAFSKIDTLTNQPYTKLYCIDYGPDGQLERPLIFASQLNHKKAHVASAAFTPDQETIYFTLSNSKNNYQLYKAHLDKKKPGKWKGIQKVKISLNQPYLSIKDLYINPEGTLLYFSCNSAKGFGGYDLYAAEILDNTELRSPLNLGKTINTKGDERSPYISPDKKHLYFSSTEHSSYGGLDIFKSRIIFHQFTTPVNLGSKVNSYEDDFGFTKAQKNIAYLSSNRAGGIGNTDVYKVTFPTYIQEVNGYVMDLHHNKPIKQTKIVLKDPEGIVIKTILTDENGFYSFSKLNINETYSLHIDEQGYFNYNYYFTTNFVGNKIYRKNFNLNQVEPELILVNEKLLLNLEKIYFDFNQWDLKHESKDILEQVIDYLNQHPEAHLHIVAHTDNQGDFIYNLELSKKRALVTKNYILKATTNPNRITSEGKGQTELLFDCGSECSEKEHQTNRRLEFIITNK